MNFLTTSLARSNMQRVRSSAMLMLALLTPMALAQSPAPGSVAALYPAGTINSAEVADKALVEAAAERAGIEAQFANDERACYSKFFATSCLERAKEHRRNALRVVHRVEVDAKSFERKQRVVERDRQLEERRVSDGLKAPPPPSPTVGQAEPENDSAAKNSSSPAAEALAAKAHGAATPRAPRATKVKTPKAEPAAEAQKRADNVVAYNRKVAESEARQRKVAAKKAEKERQRAEKVKEKDQEKAAPKS